MMDTEKRNPKTKHIDRASTMEIVKLINEENYNSVTAVEKSLSEIAKAIENYKA